MKRIIALSDEQESFDLTAETWPANDRAIVTDATREHERGSSRWQRYCALMRAQNTRNGEGHNAFYLHSWRSLRYLRGMT